MTLIVVGERVWDRMPWLPLAAGTVASLLFAWLAYVPGLQGDFLMDDFSILPVLGERGGVHDLPTLLLYLTSQAGDPIGRPLAMLTFLLDARDWPADAAPFKRTSILIHALNGSLLFCSLWLLGRRHRLDRSHALAAALVGAMAWALHPLHASTVLYVVQRPTMLVATFLLLALVCVDMGFSAIEAGARRRGWLFGAGLCLAATLGTVLSKANGVLTPLLLLLVWWAIYWPQIRDAPRRGQHLEIAVVAMLVPSLLAVGALAWVALGSIDDASIHRAWSLGERVLTQPRALMDYLGLLLVPKVISHGLFTDGYVLSSGLFRPATTLPAVLAVVAMIAWTIMRWRKGLLPLALGFFFVGHALESGVINLELYFEHRNYTPSLLLFWPLAVWLLDPHRGSSRARRAGLACLALAMLSVLTWQRAVAWSSADMLATLTENRYPHSARVQLLLSSGEIQRGEYTEAIRRLQRSLDTMPAKPLLAFNLLHAECAIGAPAPQSASRAEIALLSFGGWDRGVYHWLAERIDQAHQASCAHLQLPVIGRLVLALLDNREVARHPSAHQDALALSAQLSLAAGDQEGALRAFSGSLAVLPDVDAALWLAAVAASGGESTLAASLLAAGERCVPSRQPAAFGVARVRQLLEANYPEGDPYRDALEREIRAAGGPDGRTVAILCDSVRSALPYPRAAAKDPA